MGIFLKSVKKEYCSDSQHSINPKETVSRAQKAFEKIPQSQGVFEGLEEVGQLDVMGLPVYKVNCKTRYNEWGKGISEAQSKASAIMERIERFSSIAKNWEKPPIIKNKKFSEIKDKAISYWDFVPCNLNRALWDKKKMDELEMDWVRVFSLISKKEMLVPAQLVFFQYKQKNYIDYTCSTGLASGNTLEEAILQALCEVVERHFLHVISLNKEELETIDLDTVQNLKLKKIIQQLKKKGFEIIASNFSGGWNIPTISVFIFNLKEKIIFNSNAYQSCGTSSDPEVALIRAITEVAQNRAAMLNQRYFRTGRDFFTSVSSETMAEYCWRAQAIKKISIQELPNISQKDFKEDIELAIMEIFRKGYDVLISDLTHPIIGIPVVRVIIPGLQPNFLLLGHGVLNRKSRISKHLKSYDQVVESCKKRIFENQKIDN